MSPAFTYLAMEKWGKEVFPVVGGIYQRNHCIETIANHRKDFIY